MRSHSSSVGGAAELELPGFRFHPTEEELLEFYLKQVAYGKKLKFDIIPTVQLYRHDPWELPGLARIGEREWYFFVPRDRKQAVGGSGRPSRTTERGFWKATGSDRAVRCAADPKRLIGLKKTLVYYEGRAPRGTKTDWVMNEYRLPDVVVDNGAAAGNSSPKEDIVLCKIYRKAVSLKELEQRVAMEELARASASATPSASHNTGSPADSMSSSDQQGETTTMMMMGGVAIPPLATICMKKEVVTESTAAVLRPATLSLPQLEVAKQPAQQQEWMQDPFLTQLRSPWMESWSPYYASVLNF
ncbi:hypothetical protein SEVIR_4G298500v4 [Setaria viridis]|uniref:NAC domain-containing protein n=1 Tax=Setaria viridis TaxID=4556 RepID=A0A4U6V355_SETVI|nr:NAC domain-containing protein 22-like [Setaria viridis]TKW23540.1 hypothetical protein SEVIR_4G298500v2 [Setaria viridis]